MRQFGNFRHKHSDALEASVLEVPYKVNSAVDTLNEWAIFIIIIMIIILIIMIIIIIIIIILIAEWVMKKHDLIFERILKRATEYTLKLNMEKVRVRQKSVNYCGHRISAELIKAHPKKIKAVKEMPKPQDKESMCRFLGIVTYLGKFIPNMSQEDQPQSQMLKVENIFQWEKKAFNRLKNLLVCAVAQVLQYFDVRWPVEIRNRQGGASSNGIGSVLTGDENTVAYSFRALIDTEQRYAQIEKEMAAIVHSCKKFHCFIFFSLRH